MPNTTTWGITYPNASSNLTPLESHFQNVATTTDSALTSLKSNIRGSDSTSTIGGLSSSIAAVNTRLALNLQTSAGAPVGAPSNLGVEGSMHWDSLNNTLYIYSNSAWRPIFGDTAWQNITMTGGTVNYIAGSAVPQYKVINGIAYVRGIIEPKANTVAGTSYDFGSMPVGARPSNTTVFAVASNSFTVASNAMLKPGRLIINSGGTMSIVSPFGTTDAPNYYINCSYPIS
jgi:hypothetical protein